MAFSETGHYKNVANLNLLTGYIASYGTAYAPTKSTITLQNLQQLYAKGTNSITEVQDAKNKYLIKVDERQDAFLDIKKYTTRIINNLSGTNVSEQTIKDAKSINSKIQSSKATTPRNTTTEDTEKIDPTGTTHSTSRQSFDSLYENFNDLVNLLSIAAGYDTAQSEFLLPELTNYAASLLQTSQKVNNAVVEVTNKRMERNAILYATQSGLVDAALDAKKYIKGLFGATSAQFITVNSISFKNLK